MNFATVLAWVRAGGAILTEGYELYEELKALFNENDVAELDQAYKDSVIRADEQHRHMQDDLK